MKNKNRKLEEQVAKASLSQTGLLLFRFRKNKLAVFGFFVIVFLLLLSFTAPLYMSWDRVVTQNLANRYISPCREYIFGTDMYGRDMFARMLWGGIYSLASGFIVIILALSLGLIFGSIAGYCGGKIDFIIMRFIDVFMSVPFLLMAMTLVVVFGQSIVSLWLAMAIANFPGLARIVRSSIMTLRSSEYVDAAKCYGASTFKILLKHILPNGVGPVVISSTLLLGNCILSIAGLGFLGIGIAPPTPEWGTILSEVREHIRYYPYLGIIPGIAIGISVLAINFMGDGFRDALDPRTKK